MYCSKYFLLLVIFTITSDVQSQCEFSEPHQNCAQLFRKLQRALFDNKDNLFVLQSVFYPGTQIIPVLVKIVYKLSTSFCQGTRACTFNQPTVCGNNGSYTFGWTIREIFHPSIINQLRIQLPFWLLEVSESVHDLTEEYDVEAFLWDGRKDLNSVNLSLSLDFSNGDCECSSSNQLEQALGELTQWLRAYANVAQEEDPKAASTEDKAIALQCTVVEKYNRYSLEDRNNDARLGVVILRFGYSIGFILTFVMAPLFMGLLFTIMNKVFFSNSTESKTSGTDNNMDNYKPIFMAGSAVSFVYSLGSLSIGLYQVTKTSHLPLNEFEYMKIFFLLALVAWLIVIAVVLTKHYIDSNKSKCRKEVYVVAFFCALGLAVFTADVMLSFAPTFLLLFAYPISSSALLVLHIAIFYCTIILVAVYFSILGKRITKQKADIQTICVTNFGCIMIGLILIVLLPLTYICILFFYQFAITRSNTTNASLSGISLYIPSLIIAVFGFLIKKGAFERRKIKERKAMLLEQAREIWSVFGNRLYEAEGDNVPLALVKQISKIWH